MGCFGKVYKTATFWPLKMLGCCNNLHGGQGSSGSTPAQTIQPQQDIHCPKRETTWNRASWYHETRYGNIFLWSFSIINLKWKEKVVWISKTSHPECPSPRPSEEVFYPSPQPSPRTVSILGQPNSKRAMKKFHSWGILDTVGKSNFLKSRDGHQKSKLLPKSHEICTVTISGLKTPMCSSMTSSLSLCPGTESVKENNKRTSECTE